MKKKLLTLLAGLGLFISLMSFADYYFDISKNMDIFSSVFKDVNNYYVDDIEPSKLMRTGIDGMLKTLDPYTNYYSGSQIENARIQQGGKFGGMGIEIEMMNGYPVITSVTQGQPADKAGMKVGDVIQMIGGASAKDRKKEDVDKILVGQPKAQITLSVERKVSMDETKILPFVIALEEIQETSVPFSGMVTPEIGCIKLKIFNENAGRDVKAAFDSLKLANPNMKGIILDLRSNPGGLLNEAVNIVNVFYGRNELVVNTKGKVAEWNNTFRTLNEPSDTKIPLVMITNSMSASASEIVSGTMQDYDRGVVIGQKTYGKGLVQTTRNLSYNTMLKVTIAKYYIPSGRCIQAINYAERNEDGSVKRVPDSLKVAFKTHNGRLVWDGGGVDPDVMLPKPEQSKVAAFLIEKHYPFQFATQYQMLHPSIEEPGRFKLTENDFNEFVIFLKHKDLSYKTETEEKLEALKNATKDEKYFDAVEVSYESISKKLLADKQNDLITHRDEIMHLLENEIVGRYYYAYGKVKKSYQNDTEVAKAIQLLNTPKEYQEILAGK
ncbi:MAG: S41 family peptidase [Bacteroidetes bacterium]|nr:S41 family peptidase [Bacteroidota bacterium]